MSLYSIDVQERMEDLGIGPIDVATARIAVQEALNGRPATEQDILSLKVRGIIDRRIPVEWLLVPGTDATEDDTPGEGGGSASTPEVAFSILAERYGLTTEEVEAMEAETVLYKNLIVKQHVVVLIGRAGSGKTSLCFYEVAPALAKQGLRVLYCDADSPALQRKEMVKYADGHGFLFIDPLKKSISDFMKHLQEMVKNKATFQDTVLFFDTLKKFANIFDKKEIKNFFILCRGITKLGGTVILLGHANKHRGKDNELVFEGLGDVMNDTDELFFLEHRPRPDGGTDCTVVTDPGRGAKVRGFFEDWSFHITPDRKIQVYDKPLDLNRQNERVEKALRVAKRILRERGEPTPITTLAQYISDETGIGVHKLRQLITDNASMDGQGDTIFAYSYGKRNSKLITINDNHLK